MLTSIWGLLYLSISTNATVMKTAAITNEMRKIRTEMLNLEAQLRMVVWPQAVSQILTNYLVTHRSGASHG
jgi:hypothetical protein